MAVRLSVVVPVYGTEKYLRKCLDSLAEQTMKDAEFILVDDASPDCAGGIMEEYAARDSRFRICRHTENRGLFAARLTGVEAARGDYIAFLDSDDYVSVDFYRAAVAHADGGGFEVVMGDTVWVEQDGSRLVRPVHSECVPADCLYGADVRRAFYGQELHCYSWHTVWNKVYRRSLFERCMPYLRRLTGHVVMTEDVAYSCVLLHEAQSFARIRNDGVFYCTHPTSATNSERQDRERFFRHYHSIVRVFEFADAFLREKGDEENLSHLMNARRWYARMWAQMRRRYAPDGSADELTGRLAPHFDADAPQDNAEIWWFDRHTMPWHDGLERIKRAIAGLDGFVPQTVSFDVFDTLIQRPFRQPADLFSMLEDRWQRENRRCILSYGEARSEAEAYARSHTEKGRNEIYLYDITRTMQTTCGASQECTEMMRFAEMEAEIGFCQPRESGVQLYRLAKAMGRRVVLCSDMYLDGDTIAQMLNRCGVSGWDAFFLSNEQNALKWDGGLYRRMLTELAAAPGTVLHIGDSWEKDYVQPRRLGIRAMHHPRAMDVMTDRKRTGLGRFGLQSAASFSSEHSMQQSLSFRCMQALTANRFFDNGFAATSPDCAFGASPALLGYYAVGGHVLSLAQWLVRQARRDGVTKLVFLARDGWLVKQAVDMILTEQDGLQTDYRPASRRCLLPALTVNPSDFYALPVNAPAYSVRKLLELLGFCTVQRTEEQLRQAAEAAGFDWEAPFAGRHRYLEFIRWYLDNLYDGLRHQRAYNDLQAYFEPVLTPGTACFDMGYSGRLQAALNQLACRSIPVYFVHGDGRECQRLARAYDFEARCFYRMKPAMSGAFREFLLSSDEAPCIGFRRTPTGAEPVCGESEYNAAARFFIRDVQRNALRFVRDYTGCFRGTLAETLDPVVCSMPFESALRYLSDRDLDMMSGIRFEDTVFAGRDDLDLAALIRVQSAEANGACREPERPANGTRLTAKRTVSLLLHDRGALKAEAKYRLAGHPRLTRLCRSGWHVLRRCRRLLTGEAE
ncbi:MAG: glycosyltransferase [Aristaeellaceae bacterium]